MKLSTRMRYGTRALVELSTVEFGSTLSIKKIAERQNLSVKYLEQIMASLKNAGIVQSVAGVHGGYKLSRPADSISIRDVFVALEGPLYMVHCVEDAKACENVHSCPTRVLWSGMSKVMTEYLSSTTLGDLAKQMPTEGRIEATTCADPLQQEKTEESGGAIPLTHNVSAAE